MKVAIQADSLNSLKAATDSTLFIAAALSRNHHQLFFYQPQNLRVSGNSIHTIAQRTTVQFANSTSNYSTEDPQEIDLSEMDMVLIRQDPPFNMAYITSTYILQELQRRHPKVIVLNDPQGLRDNPEKLIPFRYPQFTPPTLLFSSFHQQVYDFILTHQKVVLKPLYGYAGQDIVLLSTNDMAGARQHITSHLERHQQVLVQQFLPQVHQGDKRVMLLDGQAVAAIQRVPMEGSILTNLAAGGTAHPIQLTEHEQEVCATIGAHLQASDIWIAGVDLIDGRLIEVNITSPTALVAIYNIYGIDIAKTFASKLEEQWKKR